MPGILNSALDGVALLRAVRNAAGRVVDFRWTRINPEGERILGRKADVLIGRKLLTTFPDTAHSGLLDCWAAAVDSGEPLLAMSRNTSMTGCEGWVEYSVAGDR